MNTPLPLRRRLFPSPPLSVTVFVFWLLLSDSFGPQQWVLGMLLGVVVPIFAARLDREFAQIGS
ncbi:Na+/H+ antiporter subunit E, partial [Xanthomonas phaseoli]